MKLLLFIVFASVFIQLLESKVLILHEKDYKKVVQNGGIWFVLFHANWIYKSHVAKKSFYEAAKIFEQDHDDQPVSFAIVHAYDNKRLCKNLGVHAFPTYKMIFGNQETVTLGGVYRPTQLIRKYFELAEIVIKTIERNTKASEKQLIATQLQGQVVAEKLIELEVTKNAVLSGVALGHEVLPKHEGHPHETEKEIFERLTLQELKKDAEAIEARADIKAQLQEEENRRNKEEFEEQNKLKKQIAKEQREGIIKRTKEQEQLLRREHEAQLKAEREASIGRKFLEASVIGSLPTTSTDDGHIDSSRVINPKKDH